MILSIATLIARYPREGRVCPSRKLETVIDDYIFKSKNRRTKEKLYYRITMDTSVL